jgi:hypothetical protein
MTALTVRANNRARIRYFQHQSHEPAFSEMFIAHLLGRTIKDL